MIDTVASGEVHEAPSQGPDDPGALDPEGIGVTWEEVRKAVYSPIAFKVRSSALEPQPSTVHPLRKVCSPPHPVLALPTEGLRLKGSETDREQPFRFRE